MPGRARSEPRVVVQSREEAAAADRRAANLKRIQQELGGGGLGQVYGDPQHFPPSEDDDDERTVPSAPHEPEVSVSTSDGVGLPQLDPAVAVRQIDDPAIRDKWWPDHR